MIYYYKYKIYWSKKMKRIVLCIIALVLCLSAFISCTSTKYPIPSEEEFNIYENGKIAITLNEGDDITLNDDQETYRGIKIGDRVEKVRELYGDEYMINFDTGEICSFKEKINENRENNDGYVLALDLCVLNGKKCSIEDYYNNKTKGDKVTFTIMLLTIVNHKVEKILYSKHDFEYNPTN